MPVVPSNIELRTSVDAVEPLMLVGFFSGWPLPPTPNTHLEILRNSSYVVIAVDTMTAQVVGFINCISDGILSAYIPLIEVLPEYRGKGIGAALLETLLLTMPNFYMIDLCCDAALEEFYSKLGFQQTTGMIRRQYRSQSGLFEIERGDQ
jgi:GNAT superfamily N-acetyltransferase